MSHINIGESLAIIFFSFHLTGNHKCALNLAELTNDKLKDDLFFLLFYSLFDLF